MNRFFETISLIRQARHLRSKIKIFNYALLRTCLPFTKNMFRPEDVLVDLGNFKFIFRTFTGELYPYFEIFAREDYSSLDVFKANPGEVVIDAGANIGLYSISQALRGAQVYSFEPNGDVFKRLKENIALNDFAGSITPFCQALHSTSGEVSFYQDAHKSLLGSVDKDFIKESDSSVLKKSVPCTTLDDFISAQGINRIDILKLDTEGNELEVLLGATQTLGIVKKMILEYHGQQKRDRLLKWMREEHSFESVLDRHNVLYLLKKI